MSTWLFDLGNTRLKCARLHGDGRIGEVTAIAYRERDPGVELDRLLPVRFERACLASVASPATTVAVLDALSRRCARISRARTQRCLDGVAIAYDTPEKLGVDRFLVLLALHARGGAALACGLGTALTIDLVDADGRHVGGRIAPSPRLMRDALHARAQQLAPDGGEYHEFAADTEDALVSGCEGAALALIERSRAVAAERLGTAPTLYLHGGGADGILARLPDAVHAPGLVLEGLARWARVGAGVA